MNQTETSGSLYEKIRENYNVALRMLEELKQKNKIQSEESASSLPTVLQNEACKS